MLTITKVESVVRDLEFISQNNNVNRVGDDSKVAGI